MNDNSIIGEVARPYEWHLVDEDFFSGLPQVKQDFLSFSIKRLFEKNQIIFQEDERGDTVFYVESGKVKTFVTTPCGRECIFFVLKPGAVFGLPEVIVSNIRKATAQALSSTRLWEIKKNEFDLLLDRHKSFARRVMESEAKAIRYLCGQITSLMAFDLSDRVLRLLITLTYSKLSESAFSDQPISVPLQLTQEQMAAFTGSCQQNISETLKKLTESGLIRISGKEIILLKPHKILKYCGMIS